MDENAGAGLGLNSPFVVPHQQHQHAQQHPQHNHHHHQQQVQAPREFLRDVLGGGGQDYFRLDVLRAGQEAHRQQDHQHGFVSYAQQQQQQQQHQQRFAQNLQQTPHDELYFRQIGQAAAASAPPGRRFLESRRDEEYGESSEEQQRLALTNAGSSENAYHFAAKDHLQLHQITPLSTSSSNLDGPVLPLADIISRHQQQAQAQVEAVPIAAASHQEQLQQHKKASHDGGVTCKECGNQAKKDCPYQRCRTCCKSRSFDCQTHIKSTWVPAAKRRERHAMPDSSASGDGGIPIAKRARSGNFQLGGSCTPTSSGGSPRSETAPPFRGCQFPMEVRAHAVFKCVKLTTVEDGEDEYAYQASVRIGGHIFKGVLHDRGLDTTSDIADNNNVTNVTNFNNFSGTGGSNININNAVVASRMSSLQLGGPKSLLPQGVALDPVSLYGSLHSPIEEMREARHLGGSW